jgi:hypothetical protein
MGTVGQHEIGGLLEMAGARIRGRNRADCPECKRLRAVSFTDTAFCCHGLGCEFRGGAGTLRKRLGVEREWLPKAEYIRRIRERELASKAALTLYAVVRSRRMALLEDLHMLNQREAVAHDAGPDSESAWESFELVYRERPRIESELDFLETASAAELAEKLDVLKNAAEKSLQDGSGCFAARC